MFVLEKIKKYLKLYRTKFIGPVYFKRLLRIYKDIDIVFDNLEKISKNFNKPIFWYEKVEEELEIAKRYGINYTIDIPDYLNDFEEFPPILSYLGNIDLLNQQIITIVGTRKPTILGLKFTSELVKNLDFTTCSGFAKGIDSVVHEYSKNTIAFLPGGLVNFYPKENVFLYEKIKKDGLLISDMPPLYEARTHDFPRRNQYLAILGRGVIITEAGEKSGSLITGEFANKFKKKLFVVPGHPYDLNYKGNNILLKKGASILIDNLLLDIKVEEKQEKISIETPDDLEREKIYQLISFTPISIEDLFLYTKISTQKTIVILMELEILDLIIVNNNYVLKKI